MAPAAAILLAILTASAAFTDIRSRQIPNSLIIAGCVAALALQTWQGNLLAAAQGFGLALLIYLPLCLLRAMGGGDLKLMATIGLITGPNIWLTLFVLTSIIGGVIALIVIVYNGLGRRVLLNLKHILTTFPPWRNRPELDVHSGKGVALPHAVSIAIATFLYLLADSMS